MHDIFEYKSCHMCTVCMCVFYHSLLFGTLYPAYCSFKAVKSKNVKEYVSTQFIKAHAYLYPCSTDSSHLNI